MRASRPSRGMVAFSPMKTALRGPTSRVVCTAMLWAASSVGSTGCGKVSEAAAGAAAASQSVPNSLNAPSLPSFENANYKAEIHPAGPCKKDQTCTAVVLVEAKGDYHINDKYPYKFRAEDPAPQGLKYPKPTVGKEDATIEEHKVTLKVPFISEGAGDVKVAGTLSLSVCSAANCLMDKQALEVTVKVE
jgi:hypothetical protein